MTDEYRNTLIQELKYQDSYQTAEKDIIIIVHNQYDLVKKCLSSIKKNTSNYRILIWNNNSDKKTSNLIKDYTMKTSDENIGFIEPNNELIKLTTSPYIILLNSDTIVKKGWDEAMIGMLQQNPNLGVVGYQGGMLDENYMGSKVCYGSNIDYVCGWCLCLHRKTYEEFGLFDENLKFAYGEDSDFCLKLKMNKKEIYALNLKLVDHVGNATAKNVNTSQAFKENHEYLKKKWANTKVKLWEEEKNTTPANFAV